MPGAFDWPGRNRPTLKAKGDETMKRLLWPLALAAWLLAAAGGAAAGPQSAQECLELIDPAGDIRPISTSGGERPGFDVLKLSICSDGKMLRIKTLLKEPPGSFASSVLLLYFDTDNDPATGARLQSFGQPGGFEYWAELQACIEFDNGMVACVGGSRTAKVKKRFAGMNLRRFRGKQEHEAEWVMDAMGFPGRKPAPKTPIQGRTVLASFDYASLGVKPGQTVRILVSEACAPRSKSLFPTILLTLQ
jgi:hypothetical protein